LMVDDSYSIPENGEVQMLLLLLEGNFLSFGTG
jgi:hypothetical protein